MACDARKSTDNGHGALQVITMNSMLTTLIDPNEIISNSCVIENNPILYVTLGKFFKNVLEHNIIEYSEKGKHNTFKKFLKSFKIFDLKKKKNI